MLVDSHCHLDCLDLSLHQNSIDKVLETAKAAGVVRMLCVAIELEKHDILLKLAKTYPTVDISVGIHPNHLPDQVLAEEQLMKCAKNHEVVAVGETGLDYYRSDEAQKYAQQERFRQHIRVARALDKPLIIHMRHAAEDTMRILHEERARDVGGVFHCFTEDWPIAQQALDLGFYISFSGILTFRNAKVLHEVAKQVPCGALLIETDSPYLAPEPHRGKANQPAYVYHVATYLAKLRQEPFELIAQYSWDNYHYLFKRSS